MGKKNFRSCEPDSYFFFRNIGKNYDEFTRLLQGHIQNEVDMSSRRTCRATCDAYSYTTSYGCYDYKSDFCQKIERCNGNIIGCYFVESHASICVSVSDYIVDFIKFLIANDFSGIGGSLLYRLLMQQHKVCATHHVIEVTDWLKRNFRIVVAPKEFRFDTLSYASLRATFR